MLEGQNAALAAERAAPEEYKQLQLIQEQLINAQQENNYEQIAILDRSFHEAIAAYTHNPLMITAMAAIAETCEIQTREALSKISVLSETIEKIVSMHQAILDAIRNQSPAEAMTDMLNHIADISD